MSTIDNIYVLNGLISKFINNRAQFFCAFIDYTKAFDYIVLENVWYKLINLGVRGKILNIIQSMYTCVKSRIKFLNRLSEDYTCALGVRQGERFLAFI